MTIREHTARDRAIGAELRAWRLRAQLQGNEVAQRLSWSPTKVANIEYGRRRVSEVDAAMYLACCRTPGDDIQQVLDFFRDRHEYWVQPHGTKLADELLSLITMQTTATTIQSFELAMIPGLLQTEDYARTLIMCGRTPEHAIETKVRARKDMQALLRRQWPPECLFFIQESALQLPVGSNAIMNDQLLNLVFASARPHIRIRVVPAQAGPHAGMGGPFSVMTYPTAMPVVYLEHEVASLFLDSPDSVASYREILARLASIALDEQQSRSWLAELASAYDRPREGDDELVGAEELPLA